MTGVLKKNKISRRTFVLEEVESWCTRGGIVFEIGYL